MLKHLLPVTYYCPKFWTLLFAYQNRTLLQRFLLQLSSNVTSANTRQGDPNLMLVRTAVLLVVFSRMNV